MDSSINLQSAVAVPRAAQKVQSDVAVPVQLGNGFPAAGNTSPQTEPVSLVPSAKAPTGVSAAEQAAEKIAEDIASGDSADRSAKAVARLNEYLSERDRNLEFSIDDATGRTILKVIHAGSGEVIRQIPAEELLQIARAFIEGTGSLIESEA
ncbi:MAG: flagellar protein FlaG [Spongiibacteraceae bacterium]